MPLNVVIIAVIALIVLVVLVVIFTGRIRGFGKDVVSCTTRSGECKLGPSCPDDGAVYAEIENTDCSQQNQICCVKVY